VTETPFFSRIQQDTSQTTQWALNSLYNSKPIATCAALPSPPVPKQAAARAATASGARVCAAGSLVVLPDPADAPAAVDGGVAVLVGHTDLDQVRAGVGVHNVPVNEHARVVLAAERQGGGGRGGGERDLRAALHRAVVQGCKGHTGKLENGNRRERAGSTTGTRCRGAAEGRHLASGCRGLRAHLET
jgi:hypothetical protein